MSSKFLSSDSALGLASLQDGTFNLSVASASMSDLTPGLPVKTNADKKLVSGLIEPDEINATVVTNPLVGTLEATDFKTDTYSLNTTLTDHSARITTNTNDISTLESKTQNLTGTAGVETTFVGSLIAGDVKTNTDYGGNVSIQLDATDINISSTNLTWNGQPIGGSGGVENPMVADLDCGGRDLTNIGNTADTSI